MDYSNLRSKSLEEVLQQVQALQAMASESQVKSVAAVAVRCTIEAAEKVSDLAHTIQRAEDRMAAGVIELVSQLDSTRRQLKSSSEAASQQTAALVHWTKVLAFATAAYTLVAGGLLLVALLNL